MKRRRKDRQRINVRAMYEQHKGLIRSRVRYFNTLTGIDSDDLLSVANHTFARAVHMYKPSKGAVFGTYLYRSITNSLLNYTHRNYRTTIDGEPSVYEKEIQDTGPSPVRKAEWQDVFASLSADAQEVVSIILDSHADFIEALGGNYNPRNIRGTMRRYLRGHKDWKWPRIWNVMKELKITFSLPVN